MQCRGFHEKKNHLKRINVSNNEIYISNERLDKLWSDLLMSSINILYLCYPEHEDFYLFVIFFLPHRKNVSW